MEAVRTFIGSCSFVPTGSVWDWAVMLFAVGALNLTPLPCLAAPVISDVQVVRVIESQAEITWQTNEPATSKVNYGLECRQLISGPIQNMFAAWDILNFDPADSSQAILGVDQVILERLEVPHLP